jgi:PilZ domain
MADEKRSGRRFPIKLTVSRKSEPAGMFEQLGETRDVSHGGVYFYSDREITRDSEIEIIIPMPPTLPDAGDASLLCRCKIARIEAVPGGRHGIGAIIKSYALIPHV